MFTSSEDTLSIRANNFHQSNEGYCEALIDLRVFTCVQVMMKAAAHLAIYESTHPVKPLLHTEECVQG